MKTIYDSYSLGLRLSHRALTRNLERFVALADTGAAPAGLGEYVHLYGEFLDVHHAGEDRSLFPALHRHTAGRSTDAAHLERWTADHREIGRLGRELDKLSRTPVLRELADRSRDLLAILGPHVESEEAVLTAGHLAEMIPAPELATAVDEVARANRSRALAMAGFFASSLEPAERQAMFGDAPWLFRRVLLPISRRRMRRFEGIVHAGGAA
jgi:hypothetical protein